MVTTAIIKGSAGLNTESDQARTYYDKNPSPYTGNLGLSFFSACMNIDIDDKMRVSRRKGMIKRVPENAHSLHVIDTQHLLFGADDGLFLLLAGFTGYSLIANVTPGRVSAVTVDGVTRWTNGVQRGKIVDGVNYPWVKGNVISDNLTRIFYDPPVGKYLAYHNAQILIGAGKTIWKSWPYGPDVFALDDYYSLESDVSMVRPVGGGIYIADSDRTFFVSGDDWKPVDDHPALAYASTEAVGTMIEGKFTSGGKTQVAFWLTNEGVMYGDATGNVLNITEERIDLLGPYSEGAILVDGSTLIANFIK